MTICEHCHSTSLITLPTGMIEACTFCRAFDLSWQPYYAWLDEMYRRKKAKQEGRPYLDGKSDISAEAQRS